MERAMSEREILVADSDSEVRRQMAESFREAGYDVETTDSAVHVFCTVLEKQIPVVLLGSGFDKKIALTDLVPLLKKCNRGVTIILVSDDESLPVVRTIRQEGIFYHALKPSSQEDTEEILKAVECAFKKSDRSHPGQLAARNEMSAAYEPHCAADSMPAQASGNGMLPDTTLVSRHGGETKMKTRTAIIAATVAALAGLVALVVTATGGLRESSDIVIWGFLGFCALIVVGQLLPAFFSFMAAKKVAEQRIQEELDASGEKQHAHAVFDRTK
jgi:FixJ family two-component response regulator